MVHKVCYPTDCEIAGLHVDSENLFENKPSNCEIFCRVHVTLLLIGEWILKIV